ncbi:MAG: hypothetical protein ACKPKO_42690, partial [Candidatus Fonsibacter sp.]
MEIICVGIMHGVVFGHLRGDWATYVGEYPCLTQKTRCDILWCKLKDWYNEHKPTSQIQTLGVTKFTRGDDSDSSVKAQQQDKALDTMLVSNLQNNSMTGTTPSTH